MLSYILTLQSTLFSDDVIQLIHFGSAVLLLIPHHFKAILGSKFSPVVQSSDFRQPVIDYALSLQHYHLLHVISGLDSLDFPKLPLKAKFRKCR